MPLCTTKNSSAAALPRLGRPVVMSKGLIGLPDASVSPRAEGPSPRPLSPWQSTQPKRRKATLPRTTADPDRSGGSGIESATGFGPEKRGGNDLTTSTKAQRPASDRPPPAGLGVPAKPRLTV